MTTKYKWLPSEPTDEVKLAMANAFIASLQIAKERYDLTDANTCATILGFVFEQAWQAAPDVEQEPAVYLVWHDGEFTYTKHPEEYQNTYEAFLPLYTNPQPKREPLSDDDIWRIWDEGDNVSSALCFAKAIEKAHGIGVENDAQKEKL